MLNALFRFSRGFPLISPQRTRMNNSSFFQYSSNAAFSVASWFVVLIFGMPMTYVFVLYEQYGHDLQRTVINQIYSFGIQSMVAYFFIVTTPRLLLPLFGPYSETTCSLITLGNIFFNINAGNVVIVFTFVKYLFTCYYKRVGAFDEEFAVVFFKSWILGISGYIGTLIYFSYGTYDVWFVICAKKSLQDLTWLPKIYRGPIRVELLYAFMVNVVVTTLMIPIARAKNRFQVQMETSVPSQFMPPKKIYPTMVNLGLLILNLIGTTFTAGPGIYLMVIDELPHFTWTFSLFVTFATVAPCFMMFLVLPVVGYMQNKDVQKFVQRKISMLRPQ